MKKSIFVFALILYANHAFAQDILPPKPKGPIIKTDAIENYQWSKDAKSKDSKTMLAYYKANDFKNALKIATSISQKDDMNANALAGYIYEMGLGLEQKEYDLAAKYYRIAYAKGSIDAMVGLGRLASINQGGIGIIEATNALETALKAKRSEAAMPLADILINNNLDRKRGFTLYQMLAAACDKQGLFVYKGRANTPDATFPSGECAMYTGSSALYGSVKKNAKFAYGIAPLPYYPDVTGAPQNTVIGAASLWVMAGKKPAEYKGVAAFFNFLSSPEVQAKSHQRTGYLPITKAAFELTDKSGFYKQ